MISPERHDALQIGWVKLLEQFDVALAAAYPPFDSLVKVYSPPERHYHNLEHLIEMFRVADRIACNLDDLAAVKLAIWFHDAVYDPRAKDNEERSAALAIQLLGPLAVPTPVIELVARLVRATAHLTSPNQPLDREVHVLLDADLAILGAAEGRYRRYAADIRREYDFVPEAEYRIGRRAVLKMFLDRPQIYFTPIMREEGELRARTNLAAELSELG